MQLANFSAMRLSLTITLCLGAYLCPRAVAFQQAAPGSSFPTIDLANPKAAAPARPADLPKAAAAPAGPVQTSPTKTDPKAAVPTGTTEDGWTSYAAADKPAPEKAKAEGEEAAAMPGPDPYVLGPLDSLNVRVVDMDEMGEAPYPLDLRGNLTLPRIGRVHAEGKTVEQVEAELTDRFHEYLQDPVVTVSIAEFHSQPISVLGAVQNPGVHQIRGNKSLYEVISESGGLSDGAGNTITLTRRLENGPLPLKNATVDASGKFSIADLNIRSVMSAKNPAENISVKPYDVITVPRADLIYVIGSVKRPGGFPLQERASMTVLEALALAQGLERTASSSKAKILRTDENTHVRSEIAVDVKRMMEGKLDDTPLLANDILFVPTSNAKAASYRALEALITTGSGIAIYSH